MFGGADLGSVYANVDLKTGKLATGIAKSKAMMTGLDRSMVASTSKMGGAQAGLTNLGAKLSNLNGIGGKTTNVIGNLGATLGTLGKVELGAAAFVALGAGLAMCVKAAMEVQKVTAETNAIIKTTGGVANVTTAEIQKLSTAIMMKTGYDDEAVQSGANMMLTFRNVRNEVGKDNDIFDQSIVSMTDLARKMGLDLPQAAIKIGKALNDPVRGLLNLRRFGIMFSESQEAMIKKLAKSGDLLGAQKIVLGEIRHEMGGVAEAYGKTLPGQIDIAKESFKNLMETVGMAVIPSLTSDVKALIDVFKALSALKVPQVFGFVAKLALSGYFIPVIGGLKLVYDVSKGILHTFQDIGKRKVEVDTKGAIKDIEDLRNVGNAAGRRLFGPVPLKPEVDVGPAEANIRDLVGEYDRWKKLAAEKHKIDVETKAAEENLKTLSQIVAALDADLADLTAEITGLGKKLADELAIEGLPAITPDVMKGMLAGFAGLSPAIRKGASDMMKDIIDALAAANPVIKENSSAMMENISLAIEQVDAKDRTAKTMADIISTIVTAYSAMDSATAGLVDKLVTGMKSLDPEVRKEAGAITGQIVQGLAAGHPLIQEHMDEIGKAIQDGINKVPADKMTDLKMVEIIGSVIAAYGPLDASTTELLANLQKLAAGMPINPQIGDAQGDPKPSVEEKHAEIQTWLDGNFLHPKLGETKGLSPETLAVTIWGRIQAGLDANPVNPVVGPTKTKISPTIQWPTNEAAGAYMAGKIMAGMQGYFDTNMANPIVGAAGGGATDMVNNLQKAWEKMLTTVSGIDLRTWGEQNLQYLNKSFNEASDAIYSVTLSYSGMNEEMSRAAQTNFANLNVQLAGANANLNEMDAALQASDASIASWQHQIDQNNASIARYQHDNELAGRAIAGFNKEIEASDKTIEGYNKSIEESNKRLSEYQAAIDRFSNIKITGEAAADEKSFRTTQAINNLQLGILRAEKDHNYELAAKLTLQKEELEKQKAIDDLVASTTYDPQRRQIQAALDPLHDQSATIEEILGGIKSNQSAIVAETALQVGLNAQIEQQRVIQEGINAKIAEQQALIDYTNWAIDKLNDQNYELEQTITRERDRVYDLRLEYDECVRNVKNLETAINEMGANAVARWNEITAAIDKANAAAGGSAASYQRGGPVGPGGGTVEYGEFVLSKPMLKAMGSPRMSPVNVNYSGGDTVVHSHTYLNGREIAHDVSREIGRNASAYSRSGGRY